MEIEKRVLQKEATRKQKRQSQMDEISLELCERLNVVNGFVTEISAGHVVSIRKEAT